MHWLARTTQESRRYSDFLFTPSAKTLNEESFWNETTGSEVRVEAIFPELTNKGNEVLGA